jgi:two-component system chemotaxis sensor kinase CheA
VRLSTARLDSLAETGGALLLAAQQVEARAGELDALVASSRRARRELRAARPAEAASAMLALERDLASMRGRLSHEARALGQGTRRLSADVRALRLTPFTDATAGLDRLARDLGAAAGKEVEVAVEGEGLELDRSLVDALREPLAHLVRNAVDHGIEPPGDRRGAGKPPRGRVEIGARVDGERVRVRVRDDGRGVDAGAVREAAARRGIAAPVEPERVLELLFVPGVSTAGEVTEVSGRGVGLDVVASGVRAMRGTVTVGSEPGRGTTFELTLPARLYGLRAVLAVDGGHALAVPSLDVERVVRLSRDRVRRSEGREVLLADPPLPLEPLADALGLPPARDPAPRRLALVVASGGRRAAFAVEEVIAERELSLEPLSAAVEGRRLASGVAVMPDGAVAVVLAPRELVALARGAPAPADAPAAAPRRRVLVADDAATTRALARSILESSGYDVLAAADGEQAWALLQREGADAVVSDVEMPGRDGFELTKAVRASQRFARLPVVLLTALASDADRRRGLEAGADAYLVKSAFDQRELLETLSHLLQEGT